jgi:hypothetical protein
MARNPRLDLTNVLLVNGVRRRGVTHGRICRESAEKRFEFHLCTDQFGVGAKFLLVKFQLPTSPSVLARRGFRQAAIQESLGIRNSLRLKT